MRRFEWCISWLLKSAVSKGWDDPVSPLCSRNARSQKTLVERAQWETHPGHRENVCEQVWEDYLESLPAALFGEKARPWAKRLADSGRAGEVAAGVGRVKTVDFLSILRDIFHRIGERRTCVNPIRKAVEHGSLSRTGLHRGSCRSRRPLHQPRLILLPAGLSA
jgi:hypothetical protein